MKNIKAKVNDNILTLEIDLTKIQYESEYNEKTIIATSEESHPTKFDGDIIRLNLIIYKGGINMACPICSSELYEKNRREITSGTLIFIRCSNKNCDYFDYRTIPVKFENHTIT